MIHRFRARLAYLSDRHHSPLPHIPMVIKTLLRGAPFDAALNAIGAILMGLAPAATLLVVRRMVNVIAAKSQTETLIMTLAWLAFVLLLSELGGAIFPITINRLLEKISFHVNGLVLEKAASLSVAQLDQPTTFDTLERASKIPGRRMVTVWVNLARMIMQVVMIASALVILANTSFALAALAFIVCVPVAWAGVKRANRLHTEVTNQTSVRRVAHYYAELITSRLAATELRAYQLFPFFRQRWQGAFERQKLAQLKAERRSAGEAIVADAASVALLAVTLAASVYYAVASRLDVGAVVALVGGIMLLQDGVGALIQAGQVLWQFGLPLADLQRFLSLEGDELPDGAGEPFPDRMGPIKFDAVSFSYPGDTKPVLDELSLEVMPGEKLAIVGLNGAGKSTLVKLLMGFYRPSSGRITVGGVDLTRIDPVSLRSNLSCVFQDFARYDLTVAENVRLGRLAATESDVERACHAAGIDDLRLSLPRGYATLLGKTFTGGVELSGGQWQRIALARAFVRNAQVILLDEPTAALDARAELDILHRFVDLVKDRTAILISHRLGAARLADRIVVLDNGRVVENGSHEQLVSQNGQYAEFFRAQAQWYQEVSRDEEVAVAEVNPNEVVS